MLPYVVIRAEVIETVDEARDYYSAKLARTHDITCHGRSVTIAFERQATHLYTDKNATGKAVTRQLGGGRTDTRPFCLERARLMDLVLPAISLFTVSIPGQGPSGRENRLVHGPPLEDGQYMRVALRPGPGAAFTCVSAFPISRQKWLEAYRAKRAKFPP